ncbi:hypothetical protein QUB63_34260 [Microcoleus sp. ARI1-B5]|uniref:hypothetical protein n=1 Tax=unclassified Microcoleus TaxID=2642155 RepID=UPI002FD0B27E
MTNISLAAMRLTGTKSEIGITLAVLEGLGFTWKNNGQYYQQRNEAYKFAFYLYDLQVSPTEPTAPNPNEPQPRPYDAVLGGKGRRSGDKSVES